MRRTSLVQGRRTAAALTLLCALVTTQVPVAHAVPDPPPASLDDVRRQLDDLYRQAVTATEKYNTADEKAKAQQKKVTVLNARVRAAEQKEAQLKTLLSSAARAQYRSGGLPDEVQIAFASDPEHALDNLALAQQAQRGTQRKLTALEAVRKELRTLTDEAAEELTDLKESRRAMAKHRKKIKARIAAARALESRLQDTQLRRLAESFTDDAKGVSGNPIGSLRIGKGGVPSTYAPLILEAAASCDQGLPSSVLAAQLKQESGFQADPGPSSAGALGIAQFMPGTWSTWGTDGNDDGRKDPLDPKDAIPAQAKFMCSLLKKGKAHPEYTGSPIELALAGYNAGWGRVDQYKGVPPPSFATGQTYHYVRNILKMAAGFTAPTASEDASLPAGYELPEGVPQKVRTAVAWALTQQGGWYRLGGDCTDALGKNPAHWCDCSSLMQQAYRAAGVSIPRTTYDQVNVGRQVDIDEPKPGDLVFNPGSDGSNTRPGHVGMYIGEGLIVEAPRTGVKTRIVTYDSWRNSTSYLTRITEVRRMVDW
ncbi:NlpC/P60 family protein [Streptomyces flaveolus]|uniref:NlpC/P60 family protein n=1 Tax=Streptomyces flaveolus TaxID=67297 RepID=UPI0034269473